MKITRRQVINALRTEPLTHGTWVYQDGFNGPSKETECPVCAVGAVLRKAGLSNYEIDQAGNALMDNGSVTSDTAVADYLANGLYLNALSCEFESRRIHGKALKATKAFRERLITWVKKNLPVTFNAPEVKAPRKKAA